MTIQNLVIGSDFGSDSVRSVIVDVEKRGIIGTGCSYYPRWAKGLYCQPEKQQFRQHPLDYIESFVESIQRAFQEAGEEKRTFVRAIAFDTTGSTPCPVDENGTPLALLEEFSQNPNAMFHLWKDHTATVEAQELNNVFRHEQNDYTKYQGIYSSEWYWAKILHTSRIDPKIRQATTSWVEHADWMPALLTGNTKPKQMYRNSCSAGHKALWNSNFHGLPSLNFFEKISPALYKTAENYTKVPQYASTCVGRITPEWAEKLGLPKTVIIGGSSLDAHAGAVGAGVAPGVLVKVIGTSTVDMMVVDQSQIEGKDLRNICGLAENSILPGYIGVEAGQAAFGDIFAWFQKVILWPIKHFFPETESLDSWKHFENQFLSLLEKELEHTKKETNAAVDWLNGRRYPDLDESVKGMIYGLTLGTDCSQIYRSLIFGAVCGAKRIVDSLEKVGFSIDQIIAVGGIAKKSPYLMQTMADLMQKPIKVSASDQACALGAAMYAATAAGFYPDVFNAQKGLMSGYDCEYSPNLKEKLYYEQIYSRYITACECTQTMEEAFRNQKL